MKFYPIQLTSSYSLLKSPIKIKKIIKLAKQYGYDTLSLSDDNVMYGSIEFYDKCIKYGIKPLIAVNLYLPGKINSDKEYHFTLIAQSNLGYQNLIKISSLKMTEGILTLESISDLLKDIWIILPSDGELFDLVSQKKFDDAKNYLNSIKQLGYPFKIGLNAYSDRKANDWLLDVSKKYAIPVIADVPVKYYYAQDYFTTQVLMNINAGTKMTNLGKYYVDGHDYLRKPEEVYEQFKQAGLLSAIDELSVLAQKVNLKIEHREPELPKFNIPNSISSSEYLESLCIEGFNKLINEHPDLDKSKYQKRLNYELKIIHNMGFDDYFLIIWDVINFLHQHEIITGPGRGSVAGSLVAYLLRITDVDPIKYNLLFERFLNPERRQMPDIDLDIPDIKRDLVIQYVHDKYGHSRVAQIITFGTFAAKQSIRDVGRSFGLSTSQLSIWSKAIPNGLRITLDEAYEESQKLKNLVADSALNKKLFQTAKQIEGLPRHYSTHAAGIVLSQSPIVSSVPVQNGNEGLLLTQYSKNYVESMGLLKMDFLGLRNLTILENVLNSIKQQTNQLINLSEIPMNDHKTLELFQNGDTNGIFQFESSGIKNVLKKLHPDNFNEVALVNALYRPGPMKNIDELILRKRENKPFSILDESLKTILDSTYGIIVYQEQVMSVATKMAGFSLGKSDVLRRAMSKKNLDAIEKIKQDFIKGALQNGYKIELINQVFNYIEEFANYGFNKSHAIAYSKMAYELAYLKVHFPGEFFTALLNSVYGNDDKIKLYLSEAKHRNIEIFHPDINYSKSDFAYLNHKIIFGLSGIKGIRRDFIKVILEERNTKGKFSSFQNFLNRLPVKYLKVDIINSLIYAGCFDALGFNRATLINSLDEYIEAIKLSGNSISLFKELQPKISKIDEFSNNEILEKENEYLGAYLSGHPVEKFRWLGDTIGSISLDKIDLNLKSAIVIVYINSVKVIRTKTGQQMAFVKGSDEVGEIEITIFPNIFDKFKNWLKKEMILVISGKIEYRKQLQLLANKIVPAENLELEMQKNNANKQLFLQIDEDYKQNELAKLLNEFRKLYPGPTPVIIYNKISSKKWKLGTNSSLAINPKIMNELKQLLGDENVVYK